MPTQLCRLTASRVAIILMALPILSSAQSEQPTPALDPLAGVPIQVLDQQRVEVGDHTITLNRIAPPAFLALIAAPAPPLSPTPSTPIPDVSKPSKLLFIGVTVYDHQISELCWYGDENTSNFRVRVNADFNYFSGVSEVDTPAAVYGLFFGLGNEVSADIIPAPIPPLNPAAFPADYAAFQVIEGNAAAHADELVAVNALCTYYNAHKSQMITDYQQREAANAARLQWLHDHPPVPKDTFIDYWPMKGSVFLNPAN